MANQKTIPELEAEKAKGERGIPLRVNVPYGYVKAPEDKRKWIMDEETA